MPPTTVFQRLRSRAILSISPQLRPTSSMSDMRASLHQFSGLPLFLFPCGFHVRVCRVMLDAGFRSVCPIKPNKIFRFQRALALFAAKVLHCRWFLASVSWVLAWGSCIWSGFLGCPQCFWSIQWDRLYVGVEDPELSFGSYCPGAPCVFLSWRKATLALPIRALTSAPVPPWLFTMLPRYVKVLTSSSTFSPSTIGPSLAVLWEKKIQKQTPQQIPACRTNPRTCRRG